MLDERSYRGPNSPNRQTALNDDAAFLGAAQMRWLKAALLKSRATWKLVASDMPISIVVPDLNPDVTQGHVRGLGQRPRTARRRAANSSIANLFAFIKNNQIRNVVWIAADVHYASVTRYEPARAQFTVGADQCRHLRPGRDRPDVRARCEMGVDSRRHETEPATQRRFAVFRHRQDRRQDRAADDDDLRSQRQSAAQARHRAGRLKRRAPEPKRLPVSGARSSLNDYWRPPTRWSLEPELP